MDRVYNFSPGPAVLPLAVLKEAQAELLSLPGIGVSPLEISHRSPWFEGVLAETTANLRKLLNLPENFSVLYMQGGARLQFSMIPMNLLRGTGQTADYVVTGAWGAKAVEEAGREGKVNIAYNGKSHNYSRLPQASELKLTPGAAYVHTTSNETIQGVQFQQEPEVGEAPLVCDASSDFLCRPLPMEKYGLIYACAQKNLGPAGVTLVLIRNDLLKRTPPDLHSMLAYTEYSENNSLANTPPVFACYVVMLVTRWLLEQGGLAKMEERNRAKAAMLYQVLDEYEDFYQGHAAPECRSTMNVTFRLPSEELTKRFLKESTAQGLCDLKGHRSVGGIRASIYNAMPIDGVEKLREFMLEFAALAKV